MFAVAKPPQLPELKPTEGQTLPQGRKVTNQGSVGVHKPQPASVLQNARPLCPTGPTTPWADLQVLCDGGSPAWHGAGVMVILLVPADIPG